MLTNDIYTTEDADFLRRHAVLADDRIAAVQTGGCPHTAIRDDITANLDAIEDLIAAHDRLDLILVESGGDNLTATFSSGLIDVQIFVVDVAGGDKVPRKGGPGVTYSDLLVVNKTDLAPFVGADLDVMRRDAAAARGERPTVLISLTEDPSRRAGPSWVREQLRVPGRLDAFRRPDRRATGRQPWIECAGGIAARATEPDTVHLVSAAATPLGGDAVQCGLSSTRARDCGCAAPRRRSRCPGRSTAESHAHWHLEVAGDLDVDPQPTVVAGGSRHFTSTRLVVDDAGRIRIRERIQIGRTDERQGFWSGSLHADVGGQPLLRHRIELGEESVAHDLLGTPLASVSELRYPDIVDRRHWALFCSSPTAEASQRGRGTGWQPASWPLSRLHRGRDLLEFLDPGAGVRLLLGDGEVSACAADRKVTVHDSSVVSLRRNPTR